MIPEPDHFLSFQKTSGNDGSRYFWKIALLAVTIKDSAIQHLSILA